MHRSPVASDFASVEQAVNCGSRYSNDLSNMNEALGKCRAVAAVLVFHQDAQKPPRYHLLDNPHRSVSMCKQALHAKLGLSSAETLVLGRYNCDDSSEYHPYTLTIVDERDWLKTNDPPRPQASDIINMAGNTVYGNPCVRLAAWVAPRYPEFGNRKYTVINIHVDRYQRWGYTLIPSGDAITRADDIEWAQRAFGSQYHFEHEGRDLYIRNPDDASVTPLDAHLLKNPEVVRYAKYVARLQAMERLPYKNGVPANIITYGNTWGNITNVHFQNQWIGSMKMTDSIGKWYSRALVLLHNKTLPEFLDMQVIKREVHTTLPTPYHLLDNRHRKIVASLQSIAPPPTAVVPAPEEVKKITLRPEQMDVLSEMLRREKEDPLEDKLFVKISENEQLELFYAPFFSCAAGRQVHGYRPHGTASCHFGGLVVAGLGWGKTVLALSLMEATPGTKTVVVVPTKDLALQWKRMAECMTTLSSEVYTAKKCKAEPNVTVDVVIVTYAMIKYMNAFVFDRVIYDEIHEVKPTQWRCLEKCNIKWGLTATIAEKRDPKIIGSIVANLIHYDNLSFNYIPLFLKMLTINARDSSVSKTWVQHDPVVDQITMPPAYKTLYDDLLTDLADNHWTPESRTALLKCHAVASGAGVYHVPPRVCMDGTVGLSSVNRKRRFMPDAVYDSENCPICKDQPTNAAVLSCGHVFCEACVTGWITRFHSCPMCRQASGRTLPLEQVMAHLEQPTEEVQECDGWSDCRAVRTTELIQATPAEDKVIVFSLYDPNLCALKALLKEQGVPHSCGTKKENVKVYLLNLGTHCAGLNLQMANHCIFMEKPLDDVSYSQAVGRVSRAGQSKDVHITLLQDVRFDA